MWTSYNFKDNLRACTAHADIFETTFPELLDQFLKAPKNYEDLLLNFVTSTLLSDDKTPTQKFYTLYIFSIFTRSDNIELLQKFSKQGKSLQYIFKAAQCNLVKEDSRVRKNEKFFSTRAQNVDALISVNFTRLSLEILIHWNNLRRKTAYFSSFEVFEYYYDYLDSQMNIPKQFYFIGKDYALDQNLAEWDFSKSMPRLKTDVKQVVIPEKKIPMVVIAIPEDSNDYNSARSVSMPIKSADTIKPEVKSSFAKKMNRQQTSVDNIVAFLKNISSADQDKNTQEEQQIKPEPELENLYSQPQETTEETNALKEDLLLLENQKVAFEVDLSIGMKTDEDKQIEKINIPAIPDQVPLSTSMELTPVHTPKPIMASRTRTLSHGAFHSESQTAQTKSMRRSDTHTNIKPKPKPITSPTHAQNTSFASRNFSGQLSNVSSPVNTKNSLHNDNTKMLQEMVIRTKANEEIRRNSPMCSPTASMRQSSIESFQGKSAGFDFSRPIAYTRNSSASFGQNLSTFYKIDSHKENSRSPSYLQASRASQHNSQTLGCSPVSSPNTKLFDDQTLPYPNSPAHTDKISASLSNLRKITLQYGLHKNTPDSVRKSNYSSPKNSSSSLFKNLFIASPAKVNEMSANSLASSVTSPSSVVESSPAALRKRSNSDYLRELSDCSQRINKTQPAKRI